MPTTILTLPRRPAAPVPVDGVLKAGAAVRDITPALGAPLAGFGSLHGEAARRLWGRLHATALVIDDGAGERAALVSVDLHAAARYLTELVASLLPPEIGISVDRLFLAGTHTHSGPGHYYGNTLYDGMCAAGRGLDERGARRLAEGIAAAIVAAAKDLRPARIGHGVARRWGFSRNRSLPAFMNDGADPARFARVFASDQRDPRGTCPEELAVDPRVQVIWAEAKDGLPIGAFATFAAHGTAVAARHAALSADWLGIAARAASERIRRADPCWRPVGADPLPLDKRPRIPIALAAGSIGDVDPSLPGLDVEGALSRQGLSLARDVGEALGEALAEACLTARMACQDELRITARLAEPRPAGAPLADGRTLAQRHAFGVPTASGSELGRNLFLGAGLVIEVSVTVTLEGQRGDLIGQNPHAPKLTISPDVIAAITGRPAEVLPLRLLKLEGPAARVWLLGVPGEPTTLMGFHLEQALADLGAGALMVTGVCGDYAGYFTTPKEYERQHYEGASTIWGRSSGDWLVEQARLLAKGPTPPLAPDARFDVEPLLLPADPEPPPSMSGYLAPDLTLAVEDGALVGRFRSVASTLPPFGPDPWIRFEEAVGGDFRPLLCEGLRVDDQTYLMTIEREVAGGVARWTFRFEPPRALAGREVRFALTPAEFDPEKLGQVSNAVRVPG